MSSAPPPNGNQKATQQIKTMTTPSSDLEAEVLRLRAQVAGLRKMLTVTTKLNAALLKPDPQLEVLLPAIMDAAAELTDCESAAVLLWDNDWQELYFAATNSTSPTAHEVLGMPVPLNSIAGTIFRERKPIAVNNVEQDPRHYKSVDEQSGFHTASLMGVPMISRDKVIGVLEVVNKRRLPFTQRDEQALMVLGQEAAVAIEVARLLVQLKSANEELSQVEKLKDSFISIASHELRTPLGSILGYATFLKDDAPSEDMREYADAVMRNAMHLRSILDSMATLRYLTPVGKDVKPERTLLTALLRDLQSEASSMPNAAERVLTFTSVPVSLAVTVDRERVGLAISNVMQNAIRFTPPGGVVTVSAQQRPGEVWIMIEDNGIGIDAEHLERIFDEFFQVEDHMVRRYGGLGIGLSVARMLIKANHGRVWAESEGVGKGARFIVALPIA
ncbi:MAG: GAF domain-containing sensor histidine kinase [Anaerolineae bacterium]|nr:GAF domain-containing sensor histidine kinase [Anaerolineae bacterium]